MSTLEMLDALIGLVFIFLLLSLICTALNEIIENLLRKRATDLEKGIKELLLPNNANDINNLMQRFYDHPIIAGLYKGSYTPGGRNLPSYIPASNFTHAVLDIILPATPNNLSGSAGGGSTAPSSPVSPQTTLKSLDPLRNAVLAWPDTPARTAVVTLIDAAGNDIDTARSNIESWFNSSMDRVSGWYKRRLQKILVMLGFILSVAMNADTIAIFKSLISDPPLRNSLVSAAQEYAKSPTEANSSSAIARVDSNAKKMYDLRLPIGWDWKEANVNMSNKKLALPWANEDKRLAWILKIVGWFLTALAVSLGSSFWFDTLNRIMVIRSTVKPHEKSPEEASEDRQPKKG